MAAVQKLIITVQYVVTVYSKREKRAAKTVNPRDSYFEEYCS
jgi:hypothetical protein